MNFNTLVKTTAKTLTNVGKYTKIKLWKYSPTILAVVGTGGVITAGVMACKATLKLEDTVAEANDDIQTVKESFEVANEHPDDDGSKEYIEKQYRKDLFKAYANMCGAIAKLYGPSVLVCMSSVACIFGSKKIMDDRYSACLAACTTTERLFAKYRKNVIDDLGEEADRKYRFGTQTHVVETPVLDKKGNQKTDKNGNPKVNRELVEAVDKNNLIGDYARIFDEVSSKEWDSDYEYNLHNLILRQKYADDMLKSRGYLFLNEVYQMLGFPVTPSGQDVGWIYERNNPIGDNYVDFGMNKVYAEDGLSAMDRMSPQNNAILLNFNVDGYIKDRLFKAQNIFD